MLSRLRSLHWCWALVMACVMLAGATDLLHPREWDECEIVAAPHDASAHRWASDRPRQTPDEQHCYLCHWMRSFGSALVPVGRIAVDRHGSGRVLLRVLLPDPVLHASQLPARAPPA